MPSVRDVYDAAVAYQRAGRIAEAESAYRAIVAAFPNHAESQNNLGVISINRGQLDEAVVRYELALAARPNFPEALSNLATAIRFKGDFDRAIELYRQAVHHSPNFAEALHNLSVTLAHAGRPAEAIEFAERAVAAQPNFPDAHNTLCIALRQTGRAADAVAHGREAVLQRPNFPDAWNNLGLALGDVGKANEAIAAFRKAMELQPIFPEASHNLATAFAGQNDYDQAIRYFKQTLEHLPSSPETLSNLGLALTHFGRADEAIDAYSKSLALRRDPAVASNRLYMLAQHPDQNVHAILDAHREWAREYAEPLIATRPEHTNDRSTDRRLRIGYVSPDFHQHPVGRFMLPVLANHDADRFEIFCYSETLHPDEITQRLQSHAHVWREIGSLSDEQLAQQIVDDRIDILVDLAMHLRRNRLLCFARKPAPVQVTYLAYPGTTGLDAIDYHLTDVFLDPPGTNDDFYCEKPAYLTSYWCYQPLEFTPPVGDLPAPSKGHITFGSLNSFTKVSPGALDAWAQILDRVPDSRLILYVPEGEPRDRVRDRLGDRVIPIGFSNTPAYLRAYRHIDIALDSLPIVGGTTTCDALWGGAPVVTLIGKTAITRSGNSILHNAGCAEWIANSIDQYVDIAVALTRDLPALSQIRATLRDRLSGSRLMDAVACTRDLESAFQRMWSAWASSPAAAHASNV